MGRLQSLAIAALARDGERPLIQFDGVWRTLGEVRRVAEQVETLIQASGADVRAPVMFVARNLPAALAALLGLVAAGRNIRMVYGFQAPAAVARDVARLKPGVVLAAEADLGEDVRAAIRERGAAAIALGDMEAFAIPGLERSTAALDPDAPAEPTIEILTSGTTGAPKHYPVSYDLAARMIVDGVPAEVDMSALPPFLAYMPVANISGLNNTLPALTRSQQIILHDRFNVEIWRDYVRRYAPEHFGAPPAAIQMLMDADVPVEELAPIRWITTGAAPLDPRLQRAFEEKYGVAILLAYGATEFLGAITMMTPQMHEAFGDAKFGSVGRPIAGMTVRVVHPETGVVLPAGEVGVVEVLAPAIRSDWVHTSDLALIDEDGFVFLRGRADGAIMRGGFKLLPETIERGLLQNPAVLVASVVGVPDRRLGQVPAAAIQLAPGAATNVEALKAHLRDQVLPTHIPVHWRIVETLPRTSSMKIDRRAVAALFEMEEA